MGGVKWSQAQALPAQCWVHQEGLSPLSFPRCRSLGAQFADRRAASSPCVHTQD